MDIKIYKLIKYKVRTFYWINYEKKSRLQFSSLKNSQMFLYLWYEGMFNFYYFGSLLKVRQNSCKLNCFIFRDLDKSFYKFILYSPYLIYISFIDLLG